MCYCRDDSSEEEDSSFIGRPNNGDSSIDIQEALLEIEQENNRDHEEADKKPVTYEPPVISEEDLFQNLMKTGVEFDRYENAPVKIDGQSSDKDLEIADFSEADLHETILHNIQKLEYKKPTPIQKHAVPLILAGKDLLGCAQTGSGKTASFLLPIVSKMLKDGVESSEFQEKQTPQAVVLCPTRELIIQLYTEARKFSRGTSLKAKLAYGGTSVKLCKERIKKGTDMLLATPGRLLDIMSHDYLSMENVKFLILDEADRMLELGFKETLESIIMKMPTKDIRQTVMFSATFPSAVKDMATQYLKEDHVFLSGKIRWSKKNINRILKFI